MSEVALAFLLLLLGQAKGKKPEASRTSTQRDVPSSLVLPPPGVNVFATAWKVRTGSLLKRGESGKRWTPLLESALGSPDAAIAAARWVGIESGGKPSTTTTLGERGLAQGMRDNYTASDWKVVSDPKSTDAQHAQAAANLIVRSTKAVTGSPVVASGRQGLGKLYHALPLLVRELRNQGLMKGSVVETLTTMLASYKPSARVASYVKGKHAITGNVNQDIALRFFAPSAVIAYGDAAPGVLDSIAQAAARGPNA